MMIIKRIIFAALAAAAALSLCACDISEKDKDKNTEIYSLSGGRYVITDNSDHVPYLLFSEGRFHVINYIAVSYQPSGDIEQNGNSVILKGIFANDEYCYAFTLTDDDTLRFERDRSTVLSGDFEWTDGLIFTKADDTESQTALAEQFCEYLNLDASNGLDVIVWQMAAGSYSFGLLSHREEPREQIDGELIRLKGANAQQMKTILSTYDVDEKDIYIIPWQNPLSSYIAECWIRFESDEDMTAKTKAYVDGIRDMLFS